MGGRHEKTNFRKGIKEGEMKLSELYILANDFDLCPETICCYDCPLEYGNLEKEGYCSDIQLEFCDLMFDEFIDAVYEIRSEK
jgi:hypothetical protein